MILTADEMQFWTDHYSRGYRKRTIEHVRRHYPEGIRITLEPIFTFSGSHRGVHWSGVQERVPDECEVRWFLLRDYLPMLRRSLLRWLQKRGSK